MVENIKPGRLFIVATPIGNLGDITLRAIETLKGADVIACEDTRTAKKLLFHFNVSPKILLSYEEFSEDARSEEILNHLEHGKNVALISEGGTPLISDPGYRIVSKAVAKGIRIEPVPGVSAIIAALSASGCATDRFSFLGFLPRTSSERKKTLFDISKYNHTVVVFESPHRIAESLEDFIAILPSRTLVLCRELTKIYEEFIRGKAEEILNIINGRERLKGEITIIIEKSARTHTTSNIIFSEDDLCDLLVEKAQMQPSKAAALIARLSGSTRKEIYEKIIKKNRRE
jgi:16S rRNA (cytidine1402-2'-O)-methyltransferase